MKAWYKSKTIWFNLITIAIEVLQYLLNAQIIPAGPLLIIVNLVNIILRFVSVKVLGKEEKEDWNA